MKLTYIVLVLYKQMYNQTSEKNYDVIIGQLLVLPKNRSQPQTRLLLTLSIYVALCQQSALLSFISFNFSKTKCEFLEPNP